MMEMNLSTVLRVIPNEETSTMKNLVIVYLNLPENADIYYETVSDEEWEWMQNCQGKFVNGSDNSEKENELLMKFWDWIQTKTKISQVFPLMVSDKTYVLTTGFYL